MGKAIIRSVLLAGVAAASLVTIEARAQTGAATAEIGEPPVLEEIVITATRRSTNVQRTAEAISVITGDSQRENGQQRLDDLQALVPNVNFNATANSSQLFVRGIGNTFVIAGGDPGVAIYQDGAYVTDATTSNTSMFDVDRLEVLRGPQGGLYGRNAVGGAINIISAKPTGTFEAKIDALLGDDGRRESEGYVSGPLGVAGTDFRLSYQLRRADGYTRNLIGNQPGAPDDLDDLNTKAVRAQTLTDLGDDASLRLLFSYADEDDNGAALGIKPTQFSAFYPAFLLHGASPTADPRATYANVGSYDHSVYTAYADLNVPVGDNKLQVTGNYRRSKQHFINDCDGTSANSCTFDRATHTDDYYADAHFASSDAGRFTWLLGATYIHVDADQFIDVQAETIIPGLFLDSFTGGRLNTDAWAIYGDARFKLSDVWALTGQLRYGETTKDALERTLVPPFGVDVANFPNRSETNSLPFRVGIEGQLTPDFFVYAKYGTAAKDGAINLGSLQAAVRREKVGTAEIGAKAWLFDRQLRINGALFNSDYTDLQISQLVGITVALANAPKARINGAELELEVLPTENLHLTLNAGYLDAEFRKFTNTPTTPTASATPIDLRGYALPNVPRWNVSAGASYTAPSVAGLVPNVGVQYVWRDRVYFTEFNTRDNSQKPVGLLNLTASLSPEKGPWRIYAYVHNVTDETVTTGTTGYAGILGAVRAVSYAPPRQFGLGASWSF
ncbi:MAG: TonB-dependent receptor [Niveispirillum sp.]|uniref:TonB-dependent receptor n=1 Tax=Niveispirillum sp. TaxID=1917217 RepID=UPI004036A68E